MKCKNCFPRTKYFMHWYFVTQSKGRINSKSNELSEISLSSEMRGDPNGFFFRRPAMNISRGLLKRRDSTREKNRAVEAPSTRSDAAIKIQPPAKQIASRSRLDTFASAWQALLFKNSILCWACKRGSAPEKYRPWFLAPSKFYQPPLWSGFH